MTHRRRQKRRREQENTFNIKNTRKIAEIGKIVVCVSCDLVILYIFKKKKKKKKFWNKKRAHEVRVASVPQTSNAMELLWKIVTIPYQHDQHHNFKFFCQNLISWLHVVFVISSRKVFPPTGAHKAQDETLRAHRARLSARRRKSSAAPRLEWKGVAKGQSGLTLVGNIQARSSFTSPSIFSRETQVTNTQVFLACIGYTLSVLIFEYGIPINCCP